MLEQPAWLQDFTEKVCGCLHLLEGTPPIGCHVARVDDCWEVSLFVSPTEIVGGQHDGERLPCLFVLDALEVQHLFDVVDSVTWQPHALNDLDELASHLSVLGYVGGRQVWLRILGETPERFEAGRVANIHEQRILEKWD